MLDNPARRTRILHYLALALIVVYIAVNALDISTYPAVGQDEVMLNDPARVLAQTGTLRTSVFGSRYDFDKVYLFQPFGQALTVATIYKVFGFGLLQTRLPGVILSGACIALFNFWLFRISGSAGAGLAGALLLALNPGFNLTSRMGRMDILCILLVLAGLICVTEFFLRSGQPPTGYLAAGGLLLGSSLLMHMIGMEYVIAAGLLLLLWNARPLAQRIRPALTFGVFAALPLAGWLTFAFLHSGEAFRNQFIKTAVNRSAADLGLLGRIPAEVKCQVKAYSHAPLFLLFFAAGAVWLFRQKTWKSAMAGPLQILLLATYAFNTFVMGKTSGFYYLYPGILFSAAAALMIWSLFDGGGRLARAGIAIALAFLTVNSLAVIYGPRLLAWRYQAPARQYRLLENDLARLDLAGKTVLGAGPEWYAVERLGGHFEIPFFGFVAPDANRHDYVMVNVRDIVETQPSLGGFSEYGVIGTAFPRVFGSQLTDRDYRLVVFRSNRLNP